MHPPKLRSALLVTVMAALPLTGGCMWAPELADVKEEIARQMPDTGFRKNVTLSFGPLTMVLARAITGVIPDAREAHEYLRDVSRVQVAVYELEHKLPRIDIETPAHLEELIEDGWEMAVRVREDDQVVWLLYRIDDDSIREMFVVAMESDELVLVKLKGRLDRLLAQAIDHARDEGGFMNGSGVRL